MTSYIEGETLTESTSNVQKIRYCKDCVHFYSSTNGALCFHINRSDPSDPVFGPYNKVLNAYEARYLKGDCGPDGKWFTPKPELIKKPTFKEAFLKWFNSISV